MRIPAFVVLAFVASGCTIHVVEATSPVTLAEAPHPAPVYVAASQPPPFVYQRVTPPPVVYEHLTPAPSPSPRTIPAPNRNAPASVVDRSEPAAPARRQLRTPVRLVRPEPRPTHVASSLDQPLERMKVKRPEPKAGVLSAGVAKAQ